MKILMKKSSMEFIPSYPEGTEVPVTPVFEGTYALGNGYYLGYIPPSSSGKITFLSTYEGKNTGVSNLVSVVGFSKIKLSNINIYGVHALLAFFTNESELTGTNACMTDGVNTNTEINIPEGALYVRFGSNSSGNGAAPRLLEVTLVV